MVGDARNLSTTEEVEPYKTNMDEKPPRFSFNAEWYQEEAAIVRTFTICFYLADNAIEVFDHHKKLFLRRTRMPDLSEKDFFVGAKLNIFGRQFDITNYADTATKRALSKFRQRSFVLLKQALINRLGEIFCALIDSGISISRATMVRFNSEQAKRFLSQSGEVESSVEMNQLMLGPAVGLELVSDDVIQKIKACQSSEQECAKKNVPRRLLELFEKEDMRVGVHCSQNEDIADKEINYFFDPKSGLQIECILRNSVLCIIKPHAIKEGNLGKIVKLITDSGYKITGLRSYLIERINCEEFYEVYRTIVPDFIPMVAQLISGVCMALEILGPDPDKPCHVEFRDFCGPSDPEISKLLRPDSLRSKFGLNRILNAVHCTDLPDDTVLELQYFFKILE